MDTLAFISRYEAILKDRKIPKMQFYRDCDITDAAVSQWRKGKTKPAMTTISKIAEYLGVTAEYLLTGEGQKNTAHQTVDGRSAYDTSVLNWFYSLPPEKRQAILNLGDAPKELLEGLGREQF